jgi:hypothetical protein
MAVVPLNGIEEISDDAGRAKMLCNSKGSGILSQKIGTALRMGARTVASTAAPYRADGMRRSGSYS